MSTFSAYGMGPKGFLVDRPLNDYEQEHRFDIKKPASDKVHYDLSLIKLNSTSSNVSISGTRCGGFLR